MEVTIDASILQEANELVKPTGFLDYRLYLSGFYQCLKAKLSSYSYQKFADDLGFGPTTVMHQIVTGRRPLTRKAAETAAKGLGLKGMEKKYLFLLVDHNNTKSIAKRDELFEKMLALKSESLPEAIDKAILEYFSEWYHPVIRELAGTKDFQSDPEWIASRIVPRIRPEAAKASLALLEGLGLLEFDAKLGRHIQTAKRVSTGHRVRGMALTSYHQTMIDLGKDSLTRIPGRQRDISAMTVSVDSKSIQKLKDMIHAFQVQLMDEAERSSGNEIVQVNIQLFPFTALKDEEDT